MSKAKELLDTTSKVCSIIGVLCIVNFTLDTSRHADDTRRIREDIGLIRINTEQSIAWQKSHIEREEAITDNAQRFYKSYNKIKREDEEQNVSKQ